MGLTRLRESAISVRRSINPMHQLKNSAPNAERRETIVYIIGVDPGKTGGAAHIQDGKLLKVQAFHGEIEECRKIADDLPNWAEEPIFFIESVTSSPQMGVVSAFTFGRWAEAPETTAYNKGYCVKKVRPVVWQNALGVFSQGDKKKLYVKAKSLFATQHGDKMFNKATSDAVLVAYYGWKYMTT